MTFQHGGDVCLSMWADVWPTLAPHLPVSATVLEIGCAEADWMTPMLVERPDLTLCGIDWRGCKRAGLVLQGNVLTATFSDEQFNAVVGISSIEHIGLGHYNEDPPDPDGDTHCMERIARWLKPGGWCYLDVPWKASGYELRGTECRVYDEKSLSRLIVPGLRERQRWYATHDGQQVPAITSPKEPFDYIALWLQKDA